jgi:hypothetical protein
MSDEKKSGLVTRIGRSLLLVILLGVAGVGGWVWNDGQAVEAVNANLERINQAGAGMGPLVLSASDPSDKDKTKVDHLRSELQLVVDSQGGKGPLEFLTRQEVKTQAAQSVVHAAGLLPIYAVIKGDLGAARSELATFEELNSAATPGAKAPKKLIKALSSLGEALKASDAEAGDVQGALLIGLLEAAH